MKCERTDCEREQYPGEPYCCLRCELDSGHDENCGQNLPANEFVPAEGES